MNQPLASRRTSGAARRPWPFGPPLRGRAARSAAGAQPGFWRDNPPKRAGCVAAPCLAARRLGEHKPVSVS